MKYVLMCDIGGTLINRQNKLMHPEVFQKLIQLKENGVDIYMATDGSQDYANDVRFRFQQMEPSNKECVDIFKDVIYRPSTDHPAKKDFGFWQDRFRLLKEEYKDQDVQFILLDDMLNIRERAKQFGVNVIDTDESVPDKTIIKQLDTYFPQFAVA